MKFEIRNLNFGARAPALLLCLLLATGLLTIAAAEAEQAPGISYKCRIEGLWHGELKNALRQQSLAFSLRKQPPATVSQLVRRAEDDLPSMTAVLRSCGYLEARVTVEIETNRDPVRVTFSVEKGPLYTVPAFRVVYTNCTGSVPVPPAHLALKPGSAAEVSAVEDAEDYVLRYLRERGFPWPKKVARTLSKDAYANTIEVTVTVDPGPPQKLGGLEVVGLVNVKKGYVRRRVQWVPGDRYDIRDVEDLEKELLSSGLFSAARVQVSDTPDANGDLPAKLTLSERPFRTVRAGAFYRSDVGFGGKASWEHRNLLHGAEQLALTFFVSQIDYGQQTTFRRPDFGLRDLDLLLQFDAKDERPDAYHSQNARLASLLEKRFGEKLKLQGGLAYEYSLVDDQSDETRYGLVSVPLTINWDRRNDSLDPSKGFQIFLGTAPYEDTLSDLAFVKTFGEGCVHLRLSREPQFVLSTRATLGAISGAPVDDVPADKRFYAGGGGTIRGYKYQSVGELNEDDEPVGGNSIATVSFELRSRVSRTIGTALFLDGGTTYPDAVPDPDVMVRWGAGFGIRYFTSFAPLRADIAFPLNRRGGIDAAFQFYISLGQSF